MRIILKHIYAVFTIRNNTLKYIEAGHCTALNQLDSCSLKSKISCLGHKRTFFNLKANVPWVPNALNLFSIYTLSVCLFNCFYPKNPKRLNRSVPFFSGNSRDHIELHKFYFSYNFEYLLKTNPQSKVEVDDGLEALWKPLVVINIKNRI